MYLYILQHGDAVPKTADPQRPLSPAGIHDIEKVAAFLRGMQQQPDYLFHSGKLRAQQTAQIVAEQLAAELEPRRTDGLGPNDDPAIIIETIGRLDGNILIASHMPFVSRLCSELLSGGPDCAFASEPGTLICVQRNPQGWQMDWMLRPAFV